MPAPLVTESRLPSGTRVADSLGNRRRQFLTGGGIERDCASPLVGRLYDRTVRLQRMLESNRLRAAFTAAGLAGAAVGMNHFTGLLDENFALLEVGASAIGLALGDRNLRSYVVGAGLGTVAAMAAAPFLAPALVAPTMIGAAVGGLLATKLIRRAKIARLTNDIVATLLTVQQNYDQLRSLGTSGRSRTDEIALLGNMQLKEKETPAEARGLLRIGGLEYSLVDCQRMMAGQNHSINEIHGRRDGEAYDPIMLARYLGAEAMLQASDILVHEHCALAGDRVREALGGADRKALDDRINEAGNLRFDPKYAETPARPLVSAKLPEKCIPSSRVLAALASTSDVERARGLLMCMHLGELGPKVILRQAAAGLLDYWRAVKAIVEEIDQAQAQSMWSAPISGQERHGRLQAAVEMAEQLSIVNALLDPGRPLTVVQVQGVVEAIKAAQSGVVETVRSCELVLKNLRAWEAAGGRITVEDGMRRLKDRVRKSSFAEFGPMQEDIWQVLIEQGYIVRGDKGIPDQAAEIPDTFNPAAFGRFYIVLGRDDARMVRTALRRAPQGQLAANAFAGLSPDKARRVRNSLQASGVVTFASDGSGVVTPQFDRENATFNVAIFWPDEASRVLAILQAARDSGPATLARRRATEEVLTMQERETLARALLQVLRDEVEDTASALQSLSFAADSLVDKPIEFEADDRPKFEKALDGLAANPPAFIEPDRWRATCAFAKVLVFTQLEEIKGGADGGGGGGGGGGGAGQAAQAKKKGGK